MKTLFIFRRDLRLEDNTALIRAQEDSDSVMCCFILDPRQLKSKYRSDAAVKFMKESLTELDSELKKKGGQLYIFEGPAEDTVSRLISGNIIDAVYINKDYTPFSKRRDSAIEKTCNRKDAVFRSFDDCLLLPPGTVRTGQGTPYTIYSPFHRKAKDLEVDRPKKNNHKNYSNKTVKSAKNPAYLERTLGKSDPAIIQKGGRSEALKIIKNIKKFRNYESEREFPSVEGTTRLSAHNKFGTVSIRELYWKIREALGKGHKLLSELYWRDFYTNIIHEFPHVLGGSFHKKYDKLRWSGSEKQFKKWCAGMTGFPIVDAGMRELNKTGWMHNRVRMVTASFLIKDLHIDWRKGERYFARRLVDYDPAVNNGSWQWAASTGCDAQPYFRIFNPWRQQERFDPDCGYIKKWVPELAGLPPKEIHRLHKTRPPRLKYPLPIVEHKKEAERAKKMYSAIR